MMERNVEVLETTVIPKTRFLVEATWIRKKGGVELFIKSELLQELFLALQSKRKDVQGLEDGIIKSKYGFPLIYCEKLPKVMDVTFESPSTDFFVNGVEGGFGGVANLTFLRAVDLNRGVTVRFPPIVSDQEQRDMKLALKRATGELFRDYILETEDTLTMTTREILRF